MTFDACHDHLSTVFLHLCLCALSTSPCAAPVLQTETSGSASQYMSLGVDNSYSFEDFKKEFKIEVRSQRPPPMHAAMAKAHCSANSRAHLSASTLLWNIANCQTTKALTLNVTSS